MKWSTLRGNFFHEAQDLATEDKYVSGTINGTVPPLVAFLGRNIEKTCIEYAL
jgi:hypothetical protein